MLRKFGVCFFIAGAVVFASCGGGGAEKVEAEDWVGDLCGAAEDLADVEGDAFDEYDDVFFSEPDDGDAVRDALEEYIDSYSEGLDEFLEELDDIGEPDVRDGDKVVAAIKKFVDEEREQIEDAGKDAKALKSKDAELANDVDDIFLDIEYADLLELLEDSDSPDADDIIELIDEEDECATFFFADS